MTENHQNDAGYFAKLPQFEPGSVWLAGAGPGDPGLISLHALNGLRQADAIVYDALVDESILDWANPAATIDYAGKRGGKPSPKQRDISLKLIALARGGARVLRLKGGDPFLFGRGGEEAMALVEAGVPFRVIPGVTAGIGGLAYAGVPVTHRDVNQAVTFLTGHDQQGLTPAAVNWRAVAEGSPVIVMYMAIKHIDEICAKLIAADRSAEEPALVVRNATLPDMTVLETTLGQLPSAIAESGVGAPAIVCVGRVALLRQALDWVGALGGRAPRSLDPLSVRAQAEAS